MQVSVEVENVSGLEHHLVITVPAGLIEEKLKSRLKQTAKQARLDGFRPGKVPMSVVEKRFGPAVRQEVVGEVIQNTFFEAVQQESLQPAGMPSIEPSKLDEGKDFKYTAKFEVYPTIELESFDQVSIEKPLVEIEQADIDQTIDKLCQQHKTWKSVERAAQNDDQVVIDYAGSVDGEAFSGGTAKEQTVVLGSGSMIPGFEEGIVGLEAGQSQVIDVQFPDSYHNEDLKGKKAQFAIEVHKVSEPVAPELNEEFFAKFGVKEGGQEKFREEVQKNMQRELAQALKNRLKSNVFDALLAVHDFAVPSALIKQEIEVLRKQALTQFGQAADKIDANQLPDELFTDQAKKRVSLGLLMEKIIKDKAIEVEQDRVRKMIEDIAQPYQDPEEVVKWYMGNKQQLDKVKSLVLEDLVIESVLSQAKVDDKSCTYDQFLKQESGAREQSSEDSSQ